MSLRRLLQRRFEYTESPRWASRVVVNRRWAAVAASNQILNTDAIL